MKNVKVGIIGSSGKVGKIASKMLKDKYYIIGGQRKVNKKNYCDKTIYVDVYNDESLREFCDRCDVILNCAGPSYIIGDKVALATLANNVMYVDAFGGNTLEDKLEPVKNKGIFVISAGCNPGLSGVIARFLIDKFSNLNKISIFFGGQEKGSRNACADIILSSLNGYGIPESSIENFNVIKNYSNNIGYKEMNLQGINEPVQVQSYLTKEMIRFSKRFNVPTVESFQIIPDIKSQSLFKDGCMKIALCKDLKSDMWNIIDKIVDQNNTLNKTKNKWTAIHGKVEEEGYEITIKAYDSSVISGYVAALVVENIIENKYENGVYWPFEILNPKVTIEALKKNNVIDIFENLENKKLCEEGMI